MQRLGLGGPRRGGPWRGATLLRRWLGGTGGGGGGGDSSSPTPPTPLPLRQPQPRTYERLNGKKTKSTEFSVDRTGLIGEGSRMDDDLHAVLSNKNKETLSPLGRDMLSLIKLRGPISMHDFMAQASNHALHGYYQHNSGGEKIGAGGDFVTAPEISQLFGEMIGIWCLSTWQALGEPKEITLVELGPGKGTLMKDILRVAAKFPRFKSAVNIHLVELSETMRSLQREALSCGGAKPAQSQSGVVELQSALGVRISWCHMLQQVPEKAGVPSLVIGQEFLDAFPVHQFVYTKTGWREKLVDIDTTDASPFFFRLVLSNNATPAVQALLMKGAKSPISGLAKSLSPVSPVTDQRGHIPAELQENDGVEICPLALATCEDIAKRIARNRGAALLIDYGEDFTQSDSLRAFKKHKQVNLLSEPGVADITADVDFSACSRSAQRYGAAVYPVIGQGEFLQRMGIMERVEKLIEAETTSDDQASKIVASLRSLVDEKEMGKRFKVLAFADPSLGPLVGLPQKV